MNGNCSKNIDQLVSQLEEFSFFIKLRNNPKYTVYLNQIAKCVKEKQYLPEQYLIRKGESCDQIFFILEGSIMIQSEYKTTRPISSSLNSQTLNNAQLKTLTQQITKNRFLTVNKVKLASKYDVLNEENALLSKLQSRENAICQNHCRVLELSFSDFQRVFSCQVSEIRYRMSLFSKYFNLEEIDQSIILSFCQAFIERSSKRGDKIYVEGEKTTGFYFVKLGTIQISHTPIQGNIQGKNQLLVDIINSTEFFGIEEICNQNFNRVYDAIVESELAKILYIPIQFFDLDRNLTQVDNGKIDIYKNIMRIGKEKTKRYSIQLEKFKEQTQFYCNTQRTIREKSQSSSKINIQDILNQENKANKKYRNSISESSQANSTSHDAPVNPPFPCFLPPKPNTNLIKSQLICSKPNNQSTCLSNTLKMKIRNSSQTNIKINSSRYFNGNDYSSKIINTELLNQSNEIGNQAYLLSNNDFEIIQSKDQFSMNNLPSTKQQNNINNSSCINGNYKVLFKKYLEQKNNQTQYPSVLNATSSSKEKQIQIINDLDQKIQYTKIYMQEKTQPSFMISNINNTLKSLTKNNQERQSLEYGGTLFNNLMLSNSMKNPLSDQTNTFMDEQNNQQQNMLEKIRSYKLNGKTIITMASFKSNKNLKQNENINPINDCITQKTDHSHLNIQQDEDYISNNQTSEENSPLKKMYSINQKDSRQYIFKQSHQFINKPNSFFENKNKNIQTLESTPNDDKAEIELKKQNNNLKSSTMRKSLTPLRQALLTLQPLNQLKQVLRKKISNPQQQENYTKRHKTEQSARLVCKQQNEEYSYSEESSESSYENSLRSFSQEKHSQNDNIY